MVLLWLLWLEQIRLTVKDNFFWVEQMQAYHCKTGLPMVKHPGLMWSDPFLLTPLVGVLVYYGGQWSWRWDLGICCASMIFSVIMHKDYLQDNIPNSHMHDGRLTPAAKFHFLFMWAVFTIVGHTYLRVHFDDPTLPIVMSVVLLVHVVLGTHIIHKWRKPEWFTPDQPLADARTRAVWRNAAVLLALATALNLFFV